jgi:hypothetical protein
LSAPNNPGSERIDVTGTLAATREPFTDAQQSCGTARVSKAIKVMTAFSAQPERAPFLKPASRIVDALLDPGRRNRCAALLAIAFAAFWAAYAAVSSANGDVNVDVGELASWMRSPALGYKHPPLSVWIATLWFSIFPLADWAAHLLAAANNAAALWIGWRLFSRWLDPLKSVLAFAMLSCVPFYTFLALKFNANSLMMPLWAAATLYFLDAFTRRSKISSAAAGAAAAAAMLTKYWSVYFVLGAGISAVTDRRAAAYFRSAAPWITIAVGLVVLAPHFYWLATEGREAVGYALATGSDEHATAFRSLTYLRDLIAYAAVPLLLFALLRPSRAALFETAWPSDPDRKLIARLFWASILLPALVNLVLPNRLTAIWSFPNWTLFPIVLIGASVILVTRDQIVRAAALALAVPLIALAAAPAVAYANHVSGQVGDRAHYRQLATAVYSSWVEQTRSPLYLLTGDRKLANGVAFYAPGQQAIFLDFTPAHANGERVSLHGLAVICSSHDPLCMGVLDATEREHPGRRSEVALARTFLGVAGPTSRYTLLLLAPKS